MDVPQEPPCSMNHSESRIKMVQTWPRLPRSCGPLLEQKHKMIDGTPQPTCMVSKLQKFYLIQDVVWILHRSDRSHRSPLDDLDTWGEICEWSSSCVARGGAYDRHGLALISRAGWDYFRTHSAHRPGHGKDACFLGGGSLLTSRASVFPAENSFGSKLIVVIQNEQINPII